MMKLKKLKENIKPIIEMVLLAAIFALPSRLNVRGLFDQYLSKNYTTPENAVFYCALQCGNIAIGLVLAAIVYWRFRLINEEYLMNHDNVYHDYPYIWYLICAKFLRIKRCNLINVPIFMQIKLVTHQTFDSYPLEATDFPEKTDEVILTTKSRSDIIDEAEVNLIFEDTYCISQKQLPKEKQILPTIKISRNNGKDNERHFSQNFINAIINETRGLPSGIILNVFATTNPMNTFNIARKVFTMADRGNVAHVFVFQQSKNGERNFAAKGKKIY